MKGQLGWLGGGALLAAAFLLAVALAKPVGVSTEFVLFDVMLWDIVHDEAVQPDGTASSGYRSSNAYLNQGGGKLAAEAANPLNYGFRFLAGLMLGAFLSSRLGGPRAQGAGMWAPAVWRRRFGESRGVRYAATFLAGALVLFGARLAGGCTSGHMMSGTMQTAVSGYLFTAGAFLVAIPLALFIYGCDAGG